MSTICCSYSYITSSNNNKKKLSKYNSLCSVIQAAKIVEILNIKNDVKTNEDKLLRTGDLAKVKFEFMFRPEFIEDNHYLYLEKIMLKVWEK